MSEVRYAPVGELLETIIDYRGKTPPKSPEGIPTLTAANVKKGRIDLSKVSFVSQETYERWTTRGFPNPKDVMITTEAPVGEVAPFPGDQTYLMTRRVIAMRGKVGVLDNDYLLYVLLSSKYKNKLLEKARGSTVPRVLKTDITELEIPVPEFNVQKRISRIFASIDEKIELNRQTNQTLEHIAQAIFKSWFVDFEPTRAKIAAKAAWAEQQPNTSANEQDPHAQAQFVERAAMAAIAAKPVAELDQLDAQQLEQLKATAALFPDALVGSELGQVPEGWEITKLGNILAFNPKRVLKKGVEAPYLDMKNVPTQGHLVEGVYLREMASGTKFINGDTLLARITPCLENGKTAYVDFLEGQEVGWGSTEFIVMRPRDGRPLCLGYLIARMDVFRSIAIQTMTGTSGRQRANAKSLSEQIWIDYPIELLNKFDQIAGRYLAMAKNKGEENRVLSKLRGTLLPKLLSGELNIQSVLST